MSNCNCGYDIGDPRVACHATNCTTRQIENLEAANHWRAIEEEKLRAENNALRELRKRDEAEFIERATSSMKLQIEDLKRIAELTEANDLWRRDFAALQAENNRYRNGYKGGCWTCESVGELNVKLEAENQRLRDALNGIKQIADLSHWCDSVAEIANAALLGGGE